MNIHKYTCDESDDSDDSDDSDEAEADCNEAISSSTSEVSSLCKSKPF